MPNLRRHHSNPDSAAHPTGAGSHRHQAVTTIRRRHHHHPHHLTTPITRLPTCGTTTPASPWMGSTMKAMMLGSAGSSRGGSFNGRGGPITWVGNQ